ncbi:MAG: aminotransferase class IV [Pseudomonadota bacterium]
MKIYYVDGQFVESDKAMIPVDDLSILRGFGVFDIMRTFNHKPYLINEHIQRLLNSATGIGLSLPWSKKDLIQIVLQTLGKNNLSCEANIRIIITGGSSTDFFYPQGKPRLIILVTDMNQLPDTWYTNGVKVITRYQERTLPDAKVISYVAAAMALQEAEKQNAIEAIYVNRKKQVMEGTTSNLFAIFNGILITPKVGVLKGITRQAVITLSKNICTIKEKPIKLEDLLKADEVFLTGTNKGVIPVIQVDDTIIGNGIVGEKTIQIMKVLNRHSQNFIDSSK